MAHKKVRFLLALMLGVVAWFAALPAGTGTADSGCSIGVATPYRTGDGLVRTYGTISCNSIQDKIQLSAELRSSAGSVAGGKVCWWTHYCQKGLSRWDPPGNQTWCARAWGTTSKSALYQNLWTYWRCEYSWF